MKIDTKKLMTYRAYADKMKISDTTVRNFVRDKKIKSITIGGDANHRGFKFIILDK